MPLVETVTLERSQYEMVYDTVPGPVQLALPSPSEAASGKQYKCPWYVGPAVLLVAVVTIWKLAGSAT